MSIAVLPAPEALHTAGLADMTEVARSACVRYGISPEGRLHLYPLTENRTYRVEDSSGSPSVLRIYRPGGRSHEEIMSELAWMTALGAEFRTLVPAVIPTASGSQVLELTRDAPLGPCYCVMFSCAPGQEPAEDMLAAWFPQLGAITARLHQHARRWGRPAWFRRPRWDVSTTLGDRPHWGPWQSSVNDAEELRHRLRGLRKVGFRARCGEKVHIGGHTAQETVNLDRVPASQGETVRPGRFQCDTREPCVEWIHEDPRYAARLRSGKRSSQFCRTRAGRKRRRHT